MRSPKAFRVGRDNGVVVLELDGQAFTLMPEHARLLSRALMESAAKADEFARAPEVIRDQALLFRAGVPLAISRDPKIMAAAKREAETDRDLRRYLPTVRSAPWAGSPTLIQHPPKEA